MPDGVVVVHETIPASGTWTVQPPALSGITPVAIMLFGRFLAPGTLGQTSGDIGHFVSFSDGIESLGRAHWSADGLATTNVLATSYGNKLIYCSTDVATPLDVSAATLISGGFSATVNANTDGAEATVIFFYGDDWQAHVGASPVNNNLNPFTYSTGFTGSNPNQILFTLPCINATCTSATDTDVGSSQYGFGVAYRQGAASPVPGQAAWGGAPRNNASLQSVSTIFGANLVHIPSSRTSAYCDTKLNRFDDNELEFQQQSRTSRRGIFMLAISTGTKKCWADNLFAPSANGDWIINEPNFQPIVAGLAFTQASQDNVLVTDGMAIGGMSVGTSDLERCASWNEEDSVATSNAKTRLNQQFLDVLQDDGGEGWKSGGSDFSLTPTGFRVDNVVVDGGGGGAPLIPRFWIGWAIEGVAGPAPPINLNIDDLRHAREVDQVDVAKIIALVPIDIDGLRHGRPVDAVIISVTYDLFVSDLRHVRTLDQVALDVSVDLAIAGLRHGRAVDNVDLQELVGVLLDISDQQHGRPVDSLLLDVDQPILIDDLRHGRPIDVVGVQPLLGDQTGIGATASHWILDAGQTLNNATSVDFDYHVLEGIFDSDQSVLGVDGARVTGPAGMRELTALTLGANVDGQERVQGEIAELRIYAGALNQADRDRILQELTVKWITG